MSKSILFTTEFPLFCADFICFRVASIALWLLPDIVMFISSVIIYAVLRKLTTPPANEDVEENATDSITASPDSVADDEEGGYTPEQYVILKRTGLLKTTFMFFYEFHLKFYVICLFLAIFCAMVTLLCAATLQPSVPSAVYFIVFLLTSTIWATYKEIERGFAIMCRVLSALLIVHISALLAYQTPVPQEYFDVNSTVIR